MVFKKSLMPLIVSVAFVAQTIFVSGCSMENESYEKVGVIKFGDQVCVDRFAESISDYVFARLEKKEVVAYWDCMDRAIKLFKTYVRGKDSNRYSKEEIRDFLHRFFIPDREINDTLLVELMRFKVLFLGGEIDYVHREELEKIRELFNQFESVTLNIHSHLKVLSMPYQDEKSFRQVEAVDRALEVLEREFRRVGSMIEANKVNYQFSHLMVLLTEIESFLTWEDPFGRLKEMQAYVPLIAELKSLFLNSSPLRVEETEWEELGARVAKAYGFFVRYINNIEGQDFTEGESFRETQNLVSLVEEMLSNTVGKYPDGLIPHSKIRDVIAAVKQTKLIPDSLGEDDLFRLWTVAVDKFLANGLTPQGGLRVHHIASLHREFELWVMAQEDINLNFNAARKKGSCRNPFLKKSIGSEAMDEIKRVVDCAPWNVTLNADPRVILSYSDLDNRATRHSVSILNWQRAVVRLLIKTYAKDKKRRENRIGLTERELGVAYRDLHPLLAAVDLVAAEDRSYYKQLFRDTKIFMPQSNGNNIIELAEGVEYFYGTLSGVSVATKIIKELKVNCPYLEEKEGDFGGPFIERACAQDQIWEKFSSWYYHLPDMVSFKRGLSRPGWNRLMRNAEKAISFSSSDGSYYSQKRLVELSVFLQYIETFFIRYDKDQNRRLRWGEISDVLSAGNSTDDEDDSPTSWSHPNSSAVSGDSIVPYRQQLRLIDSSHNIREERQVETMASPLGSLFNMDRGDLVKIVGLLSGFLF